MSYDRPGELNRLLNERQQRFCNIAGVIRTVRPDVILLCEFDHPGVGGDDGAVAVFIREYLNTNDGDGEPIDYPHVYCPSSNTGLPLKETSAKSTVIQPEEAHGFGLHHGQYGFVLLSRYPILFEEIRSWQQFRWQKMPGNRMPEGFYDSVTEQTLRLSSKNHVCVPIDTPIGVVTVVACHPTPPVFDGPEKRNYHRNADELRLIADIIDNAGYLEDDAGTPGGIKGTNPFVVMGDLNCTPIDGDGDHSELRKLLSHPKINKTAALGKLVPTSAGARSHRVFQYRYDTSNTWTHNSGLRLDYVLPSSNLMVSLSGVFWPSAAEVGRNLIADSRNRVRAGISSDHRLVWVDCDINM
ncbi:endonuclease/exonuclease/phosphatase family protein [Parasalinivibrio latis]